MNITKIILEAYSEKNENNVFKQNPLSKYKECNKFAEYVECKSKSKKNMIEKVTVKTTKEFLNIMGWDDDLKYMKKS